MCLRYLFPLYLKFSVSWGRPYHIWYNVPPDNGIRLYSQGLKVFMALGFDYGFVSFPPTFIEP